MHGGDKRGIKTKKLIALLCVNVLEGSQMQRQCVLLKQPLQKKAQPCVIVAKPLRQISCRCTGYLASDEVLFRSGQLLGSL